MRLFGCSSTWRSARVLVVEDECMVRSFLVDYLEEAGCVVVEAGSAERAIACCNSGLPLDAVVTDIGLPGALNGWDVGETARSVRGEISSLSAPRTEPYVRLSRIRLPPRVRDGKAIARPRMKDERLGDPGIYQLRHPCPRHPVLLTAAPQRTSPEVGSHQLAAGALIRSPRRRGRAASGALRGRGTSRLRG